MIDRRDQLQIDVSHEVATAALAAIETSEAALALLAGTLALALRHVPEARRPRFAAGVIDEALRLAREGV